MFCIHLCRNHLPLAFAAGIPWKTQSWDGYFCKSTCSQMHRKLQPWWLFGRWLLCSVLQVEISHFHYFVTCFVRQNLQKFTEKVTSKVLFRKIRWENIHFYGLKKEFFVSNWRKIQVNSSKKYVNFFSSGYYFPSYISPLMRVMECIELNWLCKHMRKVRSSQAAIMVLIWVKNRFSL